MTQQTTAEPPSGGAVAGQAMKVAKILTTRYSPKKHGGYQIYEDHRLYIALDTCVPNLDIRIASGDGNWVTVFSAACHSLGKPEVFRPGRWMQHLEELHSKALEAEREWKAGQERKKPRTWRGGTGRWTTRRSSRTFWNHRPTEEPAERTPEIPNARPRRRRDPFTKAEGANDPRHLQRRTSPPRPEPGGRGAEHLPGAHGRHRRDSSSSGPGDIRRHGMGAAPHLHAPGMAGVRAGPHPSPVGPGRQPGRGRGGAAPVRRHRGAGGGSPYPFTWWPRTAARGCPSANAPPGTRSGPSRKP